MKILLSLMITLFFVIVLLSVNVIPSSFASSTTNMTKTYQVKCIGDGSKDVDVYFDLKFNISNAVITNLNTTHDNEVDLSIRNSTNGHIISYIPQSFQVPSVTHSPIVFMINNLVLSTVDISNSTHWITSAHLPNGNSELGIVVPKVLGGPYSYSRPCSVVPEFGITAIMITTISIIGVILFSRKFQY